MGREVKAVALERCVELKNKDFYFFLSLAKDEKETKKTKKRTRRYREAPTRIKMNDNRQRINRGAEIIRKNGLIKIDWKRA